MLRIADGLGHAGAEGNVEEVAFFQLFFEKFFIGKLVQLGGRGHFSLVQELVELFQGLGVPEHVVGVLLAIDEVGVKKHGDVPAVHIGKGQVYGGLTG